MFAAESNTYLLPSANHPNEILKTGQQLYRDLLDESIADSGIYNSLTGSAKMSCAVPPLTCTNDSSNLYYRTYDGSCNNIAYPGYGMANSRYGRILKPKYGDGKYTPTKSITGAELPNPRLLSLSLYGDDTILDSYHTLLTMQWGQVVGHDISELMMNDGVGKCTEYSFIHYTSLQTFYRKAGHDIGRKNWCYLYNFGPQ